MRLQPITAWWLAAPVVLAAIALSGWQLYDLRHAGWKNLKPWIRRAGLVALLLIVILGPSVSTGTTSPGVRNLDVLFAVDTTASMGATDYNGNGLRLDGVKHDMLALGSKLQGANFGIITFDSKPDPYLPFSNDYDTFVSSVKSLNREVYNTSNGSSIDMPIKLIAQELGNEQAVHPDRSRLLFYMGDGEQTSGQPVKSFASLAKYANGGAVLGYGTAHGAHMLENTGLGNNASAPASYIKTLDPVTKKPITAISKLDETNLRTIAGQLRLPYRNQDSAPSVDSLLTLSRAQQLRTQSQRIKHYADIYWLFAVPLTVLAFLEWNALLVEYLPLRQEAKAKGRANG